MIEHIYTLQEFFTSTKTVTYLIALAYLVAFPMFWKFLTARERDHADE